MTRYRIMLNDHELGVYDTIDWTDALDQYARDAGHASWIAALRESAVGDPIRDVEVVALEDV